MTLEERALNSIGYDPLERVYWIDRKFSNYRIAYSSYYRHVVEEFIRRKFLTVNVLRRSKPAKHRKRRIGK